MSIYDNGCKQLLSKDLFYFTPEYYYSFSLFKNNYLTNTNTSILLLYDPSFTFPPTSLYSHIIGVKESDPISLFQLSHIDTSQLQFISHCLFQDPLVCVTQSFLILYDNEFRNELRFEQQSPFIPMSFLKCQFRHKCTWINIPNLLVEECHFPVSFPLSIITKSGYNLCLIECLGTIPVQQSYQRTVQYQSVLLPTSLLSWYPPRLIYHHHEWKILFQRRHSSHIQRIPITYSISPGRVCPESPIDIDHHFLSSSSKSMIILPHGIYQLRTTIHLQCHLIGIGLPEIHLLDHAQLILHKSNLFLCNLHFRPQSFHTFLQISGHHCFLHNLHISVSPPTSVWTTSSSLITIEGNYCQFSHGIFQNTSHTTTLSPIDPPHEDPHHLIILRITGNHCYLHHLYMDIRLILSKWYSLYWEGKDGHIVFFYTSLYSKSHVILFSKHSIGLSSCGFLIHCSQNTFPKHSFLKCPSNSQFMSCYTIYSSPSLSSSTCLLKLNSFPYYFSSILNETEPSTRSPHSSIILDVPTSRFFLLHSKSRFFS